MGRQFMTTLLFHHSGWQMASSAWSAGAKDNRAVEVRYEWGPAGGFGFQGATGTRGVNVKLTMSEFMQRISEAQGGIVDLRDVT
jgi:hypothetical protein